MENVQETAAITAITAPEAVADHAGSVHPWRRYFARVVDNMLGTWIVVVIVMAALAATRPDLFDAVLAWLATLGRIGDAMITAFIGGVVSALLLGTTGSTLGKWIFGIRVREADGGRLGIGRSFQREGRVWVCGLAFNIPVVGLVTAFRAYRQLDKFKQTTWDRDMQLVVTHRPSSVAQYILWTVTALAWIAFTASLLLPA